MIGKMNQSSRFWTFCDSIVAENESQIEITVVAVVSRGDSVFRLKVDLFDIFCGLISLGRFFFFHFLFISSSFFSFNMKTKSMHRLQHAIAEQLECLINGRWIEVEMESKRKLDLFALNGLAHSFPSNRRRPREISFAFLLRFCLLFTSSVHLHPCLRSRIMN